MHLKEKAPTCQVGSHHEIFKTDGDRALSEEVLRLVHGESNTSISIATLDCDNNDTLRNLPMGEVER